MRAVVVSFWSNGEAAKVDRNDCYIAVAWQFFKASARATLRQLRELGVRVVMDDFGAGYSSLSDLRREPASEIWTVG